MTESKFYNLDDWVLTEDIPKNKRMVSAWIYLVNPDWKIYSEMDEPEKTEYVMSVSQKYFKALLDKKYFNSFDLIGTRKRPRGVKASISLSNLFGLEKEPFILNIDIRGMEGAKEVKRLPLYKKKMDKVIKKIVVPTLRQMNFKGSYPHFFRERNGQIDLLTFQFNDYGGSFVVEISYTGKKGKNISGFDPSMPLAKLRVDQTKVNERLRLGSNSKKGVLNHWFDYDNKDPDFFEKCAKEVLPLLNTQAEKWWKRKN